MKDIGFTGTRRGMTLDQKRELVLILRDLKQGGAAWFHHGCAAGADIEAAELAERFAGYGVFPHPPENRTAAAMHARNDEIIQVSDVIIATPRSRNEQWRGSGTWSVIRKSVKRGLTVIIIYPDGETEKRYEPE